MVSTSKCLELVHMDIFGLVDVVSLIGKQNCFVLVDDFSRYTWTFFVTNKSETFDYFKTFVKRI